MVHCPVHETKCSKMSIVPGVQLVPVVVVYTHYLSCTSGNPSLWVSYFPPPFFFSQVFMGLFMDAQDGTLDQDWTDNLFLHSRHFLLLGLLIQDINNLICSQKLSGSQTS